MKKGQQTGAQVNHKLLTDLHHEGLPLRLVQQRGRQPQPLQGKGGRQRAFGRGAVFSQAYQGALSHPIRR